MNDSIETDRLCMGCMSRVESKENPCPHCGWLDKSASRSPHQLPPETILNGKYLVGRVLGEGGFGITYLGWDLNLDMKVAIKEYYPTGFVTRETTVTAAITPFSGDKQDAYTTGLDRYVGEAKNLAKFFQLPGIVSVKDFFRENGTAYIVMEYIEGITLKQHLQSNGGKLSAGMFFEMIKPLMNSLSKIHEAGIIHRDISPDNIMLTCEGEIKLLDFGAARNISIDGGKSLSVILKHGYAPEEQYRTRGSQGPWTDIYALCATIYKAITGVTPPESLERMHEDSLVPPSQLGADIGAQQEAVLMKGLAVFQKERFTDVKSLYTALFAAPQPVGETADIDKTMSLNQTVALNRNLTNNQPEPLDNPTIALNEEGEMPSVLPDKTDKTRATVRWCALGASILLEAVIYYLTFVI